MRKVNLNTMEDYKYRVIKDLVDKGINGNKKNASVKLNISVRHVNRLIDKYKTFGKSAFSHGNKGRRPSIAIDDHIKEEIINIYISDYKDANITHFSEIVNEDFKLNVSSETIRRWLLERNIVSPKTHRVTKKRIKRKLKEELKVSSSNKESNKLKNRIEELNRKEVHPRRERCKYFGEMIQMDASSFEWINGNIWHLHLAVDDATGKVLGAYFDTQETLKGYYGVLHQILTKHGIPAMFYTDRRTVFEYKRSRHIFDDEDTFTQFSYACHKLGIEIKTTSVAEAKGRIERLNQSFQSRLPIELRRANVESIEEANIFLKSYLEKYNNQFALQLNTTKSVFEAQPSKTDINNTLSIISVRKIDHGNCIRYKNKIYMPVTERGNVIYLQEGMSILVIETYDNKILINAYDNLYSLKELNTHELISREFDITAIKDPEENKYYVPHKNTWKHDDFLGFLAKQKHRNDIASRV